MDGWISGVATGEGGTFPPPWLHLGIEKYIYFLEGNHRRLQTFALAGASGSQRQKYAVNLRIRGVWGHSPGEIFLLLMQNAANWAIFSFLSGLGGAWPNWPPPLGAAYDLSCHLSCHY